MVSAWDVVKADSSYSVQVCILHTEFTTISWAFGLRNLKIPGHLPILGVTGLPFDHARNTCAMRALDVGADYLFFLDSDVIPPSDTIVRLARHKKPIISGIYCRRSHPAAIPVMMKDGQWVTQLPPNQGIIEVDVVGAGCLLIHKDVLKQMLPQAPGRHWFRWAVDLRGSQTMPDNECMSEDFTFCLQARKMGIPVLVDTSIRCKHIGFAQSDVGVFAPLDCTPVT